MSSENISCNTSIPMVKLDNVPEDDFYSSKASKWPKRCFISFLQSLDDNSNKIERLGLFI